MFSSCSISGINHPSPQIRNVIKFLHVPGSVLCFLFYFLHLLMHQYHRVCYHLSHSVFTPNGFFIMFLHRSFIYLLCFYYWNLLDMPVSWVSYRTLKQGVGSPFGNTRSITVRNISVLKYCVLIENIRYNKANQSGNNYQIAIKKIVCYSQVPEKEACHPVGGESGEHLEAPEFVRRQREGGNCGQEPLLWFPWKGTWRQGKQV